MDFSLREWLIILGVVVIVGVLLDGYRRMRSGKRDSIKLAIDKSFRGRHEDRVDYFNGELPSGGARVVKRSTAENAVEDSVQDDHEDLMPDPLFADGREEIAADFDEFEQLDDVIDETVVEPLDACGEVKLKTSRFAKSQEFATSQAKTKPPAVVEEVIVINVFAKTEAQLNGGDLLRVVLACGMRFGDMDIFHRHEKKADDSQLQFSMANAVKPGTFDLENMEQFHTPGVSFFLSLPGPSNSMKAFDYMLETAQCLAKNLNGDLQDEQHSVMTKQTIEHTRQKIRDFERRQLSLLR